jgi:acyl carrier protein
MMALEILASIEKKFKIVIPEESLPKLTTLNQTLTLVKEILSKKH